MTEQAHRDVKLLADTLADRGGQKYFASFDLKELQNLLFDNRSCTTQAGHFCTTQVGQNSTTQVGHYGTTPYKGDLKEKNKGEKQKAMPKESKINITERN